MYAGVRKKHPRKTPVKSQGQAGPILESKGMGVIFQKKGKQMLKKGKIFEKLWGGDVQNLKIF